ncbi:PREDICTED: Friend virus susceptibility protein 1-like [Nanorana parkeri]|uniref:Friend virus susceptibility protein 1-like n=1 Tax=Nanorana parkeri TaxID=125878 RepID=UPI000854795E|nr:PREDICTED: Friend virus susceptibility protein 1-like [Nanorana parkeri]
MPFAKELAKYSSPFSRSWSGKISGDLANFSFENFCLSKAEKKTVSLIGWYFLNALSTETERREKAEAEVKALKDHLAVVSECVRSTASRADDLEERCAALMTKSINALRKKKGRRPVSKARVRAIVTSHNWDREDALSSGDSEDEEIAFDITDDVDHSVGKKKCARPLITKHRKRQHDREDLADGEVHYRNPRDVEIEELREFTQTELQELAKQYKQRSGEPLLSWLLRLWDDGADSVLLSGKEAVAMGVLTHDPQLCQAMRKAREFTVNFSLLDLVRDGLVQVYANPSDLENASSWRTMREGIARLHEMGCITGLTKIPEWMGPDMEPFTSALRSKLMRSAPFNLRAPLLSLLGGLGLNSKIHEATTLLNQLGS